MRPAALRRQLRSLLAPRLAPECIRVRWALRQPAPCAPARPINGGGGGDGLPPLAVGRPAFVQHLYKSINAAL